MIKKLKQLNPELEFYDIHSDEFKKYGRVLDIDTASFVSACEKIKRPDSGTAYKMSENELEKLFESEKIREITCGGTEVQIGLCHGYNRFLNALEYHKSSEVNIAATPLVLLLGLEYEMEGNNYPSDKLKAFYLEKGDAVEVFSTSLHYCPCEVDDGGFSLVVSLPKGTNGELDKKYSDRLLTGKNKWLICHKDADNLVKSGAYPGIYGKNYEIKY